MSAAELEEMFDQGDERNVFSRMFTPTKILGKGAFGTVVSAVQKSNQKEFAVKIVEKHAMDQTHYDCLIKEAEILQQLNHPNIVKFERIIESETRVFLVMELAKGGQLQEYIQQRNKEEFPVQDEEAAVIMRSVFSALQYIHSKDVIHRDLKPQNILLADHKNLEKIKICDFGLSAQYDPVFQMENFTSQCGTKIFMAPELWQRKQYSKPVDMWSCGIIMYMLLSGGKHPLYELKDNETTYWAKIESQQWVFPPTFNKYSKDLFYKLVSMDPMDRYTVEQVQNHPWITRKFNEGIPLTSPQRMRAFSHSQILSRALKGMYVLYKLPGAKTDVDPQHKQKIHEVCEKTEVKHVKKSNSFVDSLRILFETAHTEPAELNFTSSPHRDRDSSSPTSLESGFGHSSPSPSPKLLSPVASHSLVPIPEVNAAENTKRESTKEFFNDDSFCLPETHEQIYESKNLEFTLSVVPIKYEESTEASRSKVSTPFQRTTDISCPSLEEMGSKALSLRKTRTLGAEDKESLRKLKIISHINGGSPGNSNLPSPTYKGPHTTTAKGSKRLFLGTLDTEMSPQPKNERPVDNEHDQKPKEYYYPKSRVFESPTNQASKSTYIPFHQKDVHIQETSFHGPVKNRSPLAHRTQKLSPDDKHKDTKHFKLPSISNHDVRGRNPISKKSPVAEHVGKGHASSRLSFSPVKTAKEWSPAKDSRKNVNGNERTTLKDQLASMLNNQFSQTFTKK